jgi:protein CpxP
MHPTRSLIAALLLAAAPLAMAQPPERGMRGDPAVMMDNRIAEMHDAIGVTAAQEGQWRQVAQIMRDNEKAMHEAMRAHMGPNRPQTAVDALNAAAEMAAMHAQATRRLADAFAGFYAQLSPDQKRAADEQFREQERRGMQMRDRSR